MSCERHGKGTRSPAGARAEGSDCVASDAPGGGQGDREHAQTRLEGSRAEEGRLGWPAAGRGARARAIEGEAAGGGGGGDSGGDGGDDGGGSGGGGGRGGGGAAAAPSGPKIDTRCMHSFVWTEDSFVWTCGRAEPPSSGPLSSSFLSVFLNTKSISRISYVKGPRRCKPPTRTPISQILIEVVNLISEPLTGSKRRWVGLSRFLHYACIATAVVIL